MRAFAAVSIVLLFTATPALADDLMASRYGNTTITTDGKGVQAKLYYNADHTFRANMGGADYKGTWKVEDGKLCVTTETTVPGMPNPQCNPLAARHVGESWDVGNGMKATLVAGVH